MFGKGYSCKYEISLSLRVSQPFLACDPVFSLKIVMMQAIRAVKLPPEWPTFVLYF